MQHERWRRSEHITTVLFKLHWLPITFHIDYKLLHLNGLTLNSLAAVYLSDLLMQYKPMFSLLFSWGRSADNLALQYMILAWPRHSFVVSDKQIFWIVPKLCVNCTGWNGKRCLLNSTRLPEVKKNFWSFNQLSCSASCVIILHTCQKSRQHGQFKFVLLSVWCDSTLLIFMCCRLYSVSNLLFSLSFTACNCAVFTPASQGII